VDKEKKKVKVWKKKKSPSPLPQDRESYPPPPCQPSFSQRHYSPTLANLPFFLVLFGGAYHVSSNKVPLSPRKPQHTVVFFTLPCTNSLSPYTSFRNHSPLILRRNRQSLSLTPANFVWRFSSTRLFATNSPQSCAKSPDMLRSNYSSVETSRCEDLKTDRVRRGISALDGRI